MEHSFEVSIGLVVDSAVGDAVWSESGLSMVGDVTLSALMSAMFESSSNLISIGSTGVSDGEVAAGDFCNSSLLASS